MYKCSVQFRNLHDLEIALPILGIGKLHAIEFVLYSCTISRLARNFRIPNMHNLEIDTQFPDSEYAQSRDCKIARNIYMYTCTSTPTVTCSIFADFASTYSIACIDLWEWLLVGVAIASNRQTHH